VHRLLSLDALRGVAVIFMMEQHLGVWLWEPEHPGRSAISQAPGYMAINGLGGLAAPLFITLAGIGCSLLVAAKLVPRPSAPELAPRPSAPELAPRPSAPELAPRPSAPELASRPSAPELASRPSAPERSVDITLVRRGLALLGFGYLLNYLTPSWFSAGSWFVLHMMGFAIATAPLWRRLPTPALLAAEALLFTASVAVQSWLATPRLLDNQRMRDLDLPGGALRLALAEGQFPILPWLALFLVGLAIGRWLLTDQHHRVGALCRACLLAGITLVALDFAATRTPALEFLLRDPWWRLVRVRTSFFPAGPGIVLLLQAGVLLMLTVALRIERSRELDPRGWLVCLGRGSLSLLLLHVVLFREISRPLGAWQAFDRYTSLAIIVAWIALCLLLCRAWQRIGYRYGSEWLLRRLGG